MIARSGVVNKISTVNKTPKGVGVAFAFKVVKAAISPKTGRVASSTKYTNSKVGQGVQSSSFRYHQTPTPATNGVRTVFTLPNSETYVSGLLEVFLDGLFQTKDVDFTETTSSTFTMTTAPDANETLRINYIKG